MKLPKAKAVAQARGFQMTWDASERVWRVSSPADDSIPVRYMDPAMLAAIPESDFCKWLQREGEVQAAAHDSGEEQVS